MVALGRVQRPARQQHVRVAGRPREVLLAPLGQRREGDGRGKGAAADLGEELDGAEADGGGVGDLADDELFLFGFLVGVDRRSG